MRTVQNLVKWPVANISEGRMKEARAVGSIRFDHGGDPGRIAEWGKRLHLAALRPKVGYDATELFRILDNESAANLGVKFSDKRFNLSVK